jgi:hypothetical protein
MLRGVQLARPRLLGIAATGIPVERALDRSDTIRLHDDLELVELLARISWNLSRDLFGCSRKHVAADDFFCVSRARADIKGLNLKILVARYF